MAGAVAAGCPLTASAGAQILEAGGNAVDAAVAAALASFVAEPLLSSVGGAGMMMVALPHRDPTVVDFFSRAPRRPSGDGDFKAIEIAFDSATQVFHIGKGSAAPPMSLPGLAEAAQRFGTMPLRELVEPAVKMARQGAAYSPEMAMVARLLWGIVEQSGEAKALYSERDGPPEPGDVHHNPELADLLEELGQGGAPPERWRQSVLASFGPSAGGCLTAEDFDAKPIVTQPRHRRLGEWDLFTSPRIGGHLIGVIADHLQNESPSDHEPTEVARTAMACRLGHRARVSDSLVGGTTHISVIDSEGGAASVTLTNGEGCGHLVPGTGVQMNNFLGEEDLNPRGFHLHASSEPLPSMIAPTIARGPDGLLALGSGGSNRIRSVVSQVLYRVILLGETLQDAVMAPRVHAEEEQAWLELADRSHPEEITARVQEHFEKVYTFPFRSFFFGGTHAVRASSAGIEAVGDPRRGGATG